MFNPEPTLLSKQLNRQIPLVLLNPRNTWHRPLLNSNRNSLVLDLVVMALSLSNRSNLNRPASPRTPSIQLASNLSKARRLNNSNSHHSCNKTHSLCNSSNKIPLLCNNNSNPHKCNHHRNRPSHKRLTLSANQ